MHTDVPFPVVFPGSASVDRVQKLETATSLFHHKHKGRAEAYILPIDNYGL